jgi:hemoglobin
MHQKYMIGARVVDRIAGIDEAGLERLVHAFYARVREDAELGPIFNRAIDDWPEHLGKLTAFWSSVMLTSGRYKGQPVPAHLKHRDRITPELFQRWLALWGETARELMAPEGAAALEAKAARIAESLQLALFFRLDGQPGPRPAATTDHLKRSVVP